jgi:hypothetical protein
MYTFLAAINNSELLGYMVFRGCIKREDFIGFLYNLVQKLEMDSFFE